MNFIQIILFNLVLLGWTRIFLIGCAYMGVLAHDGRSSLGDDVKILLHATVILTVVLIVSFTGYVPL